MSIRAIDAAKFVCEQGDWRVTNLALQKLLYIAQMIHMGRTKQRLVDASFEAWDYGPVLPEVYHKAKAFGDRPVRDVFFSANPITNDIARITLTDVCKRFLSKTPGQLVSITHWDGGAWYKNYVPRTQGIRIPDSDILDEYRARTSPN